MHKGLSILPEADGEENWLDTFHTTQYLLRDAGRRLEHIASRLAYVSPESMAVLELEALALDLATQSEAMGRAINEKVHGDFRQAQEQAGLLLSAALSGAITMGGKKMPLEVK